MKIVLLAAAAFVASLGGSTAFVALRTPIKPAKAAHADSLAAPKPAELPGDPAANPAAIAASATPAAPTAGAPVAAAAAAPAPVAATLAHAAAPTPAAPAATPPPDYKSLARILGNMKPAQAAAIVERLSDDDVLGVVRALGPRQSADLLAQVPAERAATLSKKLLVPIAEATP